ncbi:MAG: uracil-DNA glycosylase family protein [Acidaminococcaceae bacterium]
MKNEKLAKLADELDECTACSFRESAIAPVGWFGNPESPIVFVGEGPGGVEDDYGCPLIGPSGQLLDKALWSVKMTRDRVLTTNVIKCRPRNNKTPNIAEADFCAQLWLEKELAIIEPKVIVALGGVALHFLGNADMRITKDRGQWFKTAQGFDCIATFHPAYLLRLSGHGLVTAKWDVFHDLEAAREKVIAAAPDYQLMSEAPTNLFSLFEKRKK